MSRTTSMLVFFAIFFALIGGIHAYIWVRLVRDAALGSPWRRLATIAIIALGASVPLTFFLGRGLPFSISRYASFVPYAWLGVMMMLFFWFLAADVARLVAFLAARLSGHGEFMADPSRRQALGRIIAGGAGVVVGGMSGAAIIGAARKPVVIRREFALSRLPAGLDGFKIVQISDLHVGLTVGRRWCADLVRRVNALGPDLIAVTGDLVDGSVAKLRDEVAPLAGLEAPHGVFFVTGNHEYYSGVVEWLEELGRLGMRVLRNEHVEIRRGAESFLLAGVDDHSARGMAPGHGPDLARALAGRDASRATVLLAHQPKTAHQATGMDVDLVLSGHTHGGQLWPFSGLVGLVQPYVKGAYRADSGTHVYVNQGTGMWGPPMRLGTESEITEIRLRRS